MNTRNAHVASRSRSTGSARSREHRNGRGGASQGESPERHAEGPIARAIEEKTAQIPSDAFLMAAGGAVAASLTCTLLGRRATGNFIGQWVPTILILGLYNKLVKVQGHDRAEKENGDAV